MIPTFLQSFLPDKFHNNAQVVNSVGPTGGILLRERLGNTRSVRKVSSHFEYLENRLRGRDVTWQPVRGDLTVHP